LLQYCQRRQVPFAEDPANLDLSVPRNCLRHEIIPILRQKVNPDVESSLVRLGRWASEVEEVISDQIELCWAASRRRNSLESPLFPKGKIVLDLEAILTYYKMIRKYTLLKAIRLAAGTEIALKATDLDRAEAFLHGQRTGAQLILPQGVRLVRHGRLLIIGAWDESSNQYVLTPGRIQRLNGIGWVAHWEPVPSGPHESGAGLAADLTFQYHGKRIILRKAEDGDRFHPLGAPGEKRLFRFLTDRKVSRLDKRQTWVLEAGGVILWVIGHRISEHARVLQPGKWSWRLTFAPMADDHSAA
jgi:tRNA(Ile)-lysidine synthase